jgi:hypothetical protein
MELPGEQVCAQALFQSKQTMPVQDVKVLRRRFRQALLCRLATSPCVLQAPVPLNCFRYSLQPL